MSKMSEKDFNKMLDMPKIEIVKDEKMIKRYGGSKMFLMPPIYYDELIKRVSKGKVIERG